MPAGAVLGSVHRGKGRYRREGGEVKAREQGAFYGGWVQYIMRAADSDEGRVELERKLDTTFSRITKFVLRSAEEA